MPRMLNDAPCTLKMQDHISGSELVLYHRLPTTEERTAYANGQIVREGNKLKNKLADVRINFGLKILTGFREGDFLKAENQPFSADPASPVYDAAWRTLIKKYAADVLTVLSIRVFEQPVTPAAENQLEIDDGAAPAEGDEETDGDGAKEDGETDRPL